TTMACWSTDINVENNKFDVGSGLQLPSAMNFAQRSALEVGLYHKPDNSCLGNLTFFMPVHNLTQNTYFMTIQSAINSANSLDVIECAEYTYNERVTIDKTLTLQGLDKTNCKIDGTGLGNGKGIQINNGITGVTIKHFTVQNFSGSSGNADGGIYAIGGNNNLLIRGVIIQNNVGGSGFYANGPVNTVTLDSVTSSGHTTGARGIVIWNGLKENITVTNCEVFGNNCCGLELQDGQASGVTFENNNIHDNADNGIGLMGLQGPGENLIKGNTLLNNGRFGIEVKNPNGSGLTTGPGRIVVENNNVSRTVGIGGEVRDIAGIAAFRRSVGAGNVDIPTGVVIQNNTVSGYTQPSTSDGFGIVVEGLNHTVSTNTVSGCDVGIQRQAGHTPVPPADGDQNNLADTYFGRGNSAQTCGIILTGNILTNTLNTRDVGAAAAGLVTNLNTTETFCSIQSAIDDAQTMNGDVIEVSAGIYNERVTVSKSLTIQGVDKVNCILNGTGLGNGKGIQINNGITGVTIKRLTVQNYSGAGGNTDAGIYAIGGNNNLLIEGVIIQNNVGGSGFYANGP
ncbi:MAG TPA: right-handed parallel beta-helix repeat-containing protein, partial [Ignavibacteria bacterium]|nr:right-handed parallel beta-helix repeat-containing protein [Ignavibacteria bacterium]